VVRHALIHRAHERGTRPAAARNAQGQYDAEPYAGPDVRVRFMERGVSRKQRREDSSAKQSRTYELLADYVTLETPAQSFVLESGMELLVVAPPVTSAEGWIVQVDGDPEHLNDGRREIGWMASVVKVGEAA
jgi:hypothetical protein